MQYAAITTRIAHVNLLGGGCNGPIVAVFDLSLDDQELFSSEGVAGLYVPSSSRRQTASSIKPSGSSQNVAK